jgi:hypothetical protein
MPPAASPQFHTLTRVECEAILARNRVGRLAYGIHDRVEIQPIGYVFANGVINCRTSEGAKLEVLRHQPAVAFEVDEVDGPFAWRSVVVHGTVYFAEDEGSDADRKAYAEAVEALRGAYAGALGPDDPAAFRSVILRLYVNEMTGRTAHP